MKRSRYASFQFSSAFLGLVRAASSSVGITSLDFSILPTEQERSEFDSSPLRRRDGETKDKDKMCVCVCACVHACVCVCVIGGGVGGGEN